MEGFEFSVGRVVEFLELKPILAARLGLDASSILTEDDYWGRSDSSAFAGVYIEYVNGGFPTFVNVYSDAEFYGEALGELAVGLSVDLGSPILIGDYISEIDVASGRFIVVRPDGKFEFAYEAEGGEVVLFDPPRINDVG